LIDGQDIEKLGLHVLRQNLAIIPQEPFLLQGNLRFNVDPFNKYSTEQIAAALESVSILDTIRDEDIIDQKIKAMKEKKNPKGPGGKPPAPDKKTIQAKKNDDKALSENRLTTNTKEGTDAVENLTEEDLEIERLRSTGATIEDKLNYEIATGGSNLSLGQRQLICIARTLLVPPKILLMDEATANID
jgi:ATP-binding cassette, subfamily C (CFTR/MRP), member 1